MAGRTLLPWPFACSSKTTSECVFYLFRLFILILLLSPQSHATFAYAHIHHTIHNHFDWPLWLAFYFYDVTQQRATHSPRTGVHTPPLHNPEVSRAWPVLWHPNRCPFYSQCAATRSVCTNIGFNNADGCGRVQVCDTRHLSNRNENGHHDFSINAYSHATHAKARDTRFRRTNGKYNAKQSRVYTRRVFQ